MFVQPSDSTARVVVVRIYKQKLWNGTTGHIKLVAPKDGSFDLCFSESVVLIAYILQDPLYYVFDHLKSL